MIDQTIARRYAKALLSIGSNDGNMAKYGEELTEFSQAMQTSGLESALTNPLYPQKNRLSILEAVLGKAGFSPITNNFIRLIMEKKRIALIGSINDFYHRLMDEINNIERATVTTASLISDGTKEQIKSILEKKTGKTIVLVTEQDTAIIGGIIAKVGDLTLDGSVKTQLMNLKESLVKG